MWTLETENLQEGDRRSSGANLFVAENNEVAPVLLQVDYQAEWFSSEVVTTWTPVLDTATALVGAALGQVVIIPTQDITHLDAITSAGQVFLSAVDPNKPQPGEFTWTTVPGSDFGGEAGIIQQVVVYTNETIKMVPGDICVMIAGKPKIELPTDLVPAKILSVLKGFPVTGEVSWSLQLEENPSGSLKLFCGKSDISRVRKRFRMWKRIGLFGLGFTVSGRSEKISGQQYEISVSLSGAWSNPENNIPSNLLDNRGSSGSGSGSSLGGIGPDTSKLDPECELPKTTTIKDFNGAAKLYSRPVESLARDVGVPFKPSVAPGKGRGDRDNGGWTQVVSADTPADATMLWSSFAQGVARVQGGFLDYSSPDGVYIRFLNGQSLWRYSLQQLDIAYKSGEASRDGDGDESPPGGFRYIPVEDVEPDDSEDSKVTNPLSPQWIPVHQKEITLVSGDENPGSPPADARTIKTLGLNWDSSGPTKTTRSVTSQGPKTISEEELIYGLCYTGRQVVNEEGEFHGLPATYWQVVSKKTKTYFYDERFGFALGYNVQGYSMRRFKQESDQNPESIFAEVKDRPLYEFRQIRIDERYRTEYEAFETYYPDAEEAAAYVSYKHCNPDGSSTIKYVRDPTWAPSMFMSQETTAVRTFATALNPDFDPEGEYSDTNPAPPRYLVTGEETDNLMQITLAPSSDKEDFGLPVKPDVAGGVYTQWSKEETAQNSGFREKVIRSSFTEYAGRPSAASRTPPALERAQPEQEDGDPGGKQDPSTETKNTVTSKAFSNGVYPASGSIGFPGAKTFDDQRRGLAADIKITDVKNSASFDFEIPFNRKIRPGHLISIAINGEQYSLRVAGVANQINIIGLDAAGELMLSAEPTKITAGLNRTWNVDSDSSGLAFAGRAVSRGGSSGSSIGPGGGGSGGGSRFGASGSKKQRPKEEIPPSSRGLFIGTIKEDPMSFRSRGNF